MADIEEIFRQDENTFTIFVVEQRFVVGRGHAYFQSFINKPNLFDSDEQIKACFSRAVETIEKNVAPVSKLVGQLVTGFKTVSITEAITALCKLYTVHEHQTAGPNIIEPIILQEGKITKRTITNLITMNKDSILRQTIIVLLKDNDFERAKILLSECPNGILIKMIRNSGSEEVYKVVNTGAENIDSFLDAFSGQCYSTCSKTKREILLNQEWSQDSLIMKYSPMLLKYRTNLLFDEKEEVKEDISRLIADIEMLEVKSERDKKIKACFECVAKLFRVFCNDYGGQDIIDAENLAHALNNEVLLAQVYRYAELSPNCTRQEREERYKKAYDIFRKNSMEDHAIYCKNNLLIEQFYTDYVKPEEFRELQLEAVNNVPGMVGLSHIFNNVGVAYLYCGHPETAIEFFDKGLEYARHQDRIVQNLALESNKLIAEKYSFCQIEEKRIWLLMRRIFDGMGLYRLPFLTADYALNILSVAYHENPHLGLELTRQFPIKELINRAFLTNDMGAGERCLQMQYLDEHYPNTFDLFKSCSLPAAFPHCNGKRAEFIFRYGYSPFDFETWL